MPRFKARVEVVKALEAAGLFVEKKDNPMQIPICNKSGDIIEPLLKPQWWVNCKPLAEEAIKRTRAGELLVQPKTSESEWFHWLENIQDWCVSRQLWWGHRCPAYFVRIEGQAQDKNDGKNWVVGRTLAEATARAEKLANGAKFTLEQDEDVLDERALLDRGVGDHLRRDRLPAAAALVGRDDDAALAVVDAVAERLAREAREDDGVDGADASAGEESGHSLPGHRHVDRYGVALLHAVRLEDAGDAADLAEKLSVRNGVAFTGLIRFVDDGSFFRVLERPAVDAVVASIKSTLREPNDIAVDETARTNRLERPVPVQRFPRDL